MNKLLMSATLALATAFSTTALAADTDKPFEGYYAGIETGYEDRQGGVNGIYYGGILGGRTYVFKNIVAGVEFGIGDSTSQVEYVDSRFFSFRDYGRQSAVDFSLGVAAFKNTLFFATAGIANMRASTVFGNWGADEKVEFIDSDGNIITFPGYQVSREKPSRRNAQATVFRYGGGVEKIVSDKVSLRFTVTNMKYALNANVGLLFRF